MFTKQQFLDSCLKEVKIFKHLYGKILPGTLDFRPSEKQRSLKELLRFIMHSFSIELSGIKNGSIGDFQAAIKDSLQADVENFPPKMDELAAQIKSTMENFNDVQLSEQIDLFGRGSKQSRATWLFELILKNLVGYKMQLFLYIKQSGNNDIGTADVWRGEDSKKPS